MVALRPETVLILAIRPSARHSVSSQATRRPFRRFGAVTVAIAIGCRDAITLIINSA